MRKAQQCVWRQCSQGSRVSPHVNTPTIGKRLRLLLLVFDLGLQGSHLLLQACHLALHTSRGTHMFESHNNLNCGEHIKLHVLVVRKAPAGGVERCVLLARAAAQRV